MWYNIRWRPHQSMYHHRFHHLPWFPREKSPRVSIKECTDFCNQSNPSFDRYIIAQIFGAYVASLLIYHQWRVFILEAETALKVAGVYDQVQFTPSGTAGIFALYLPPGQTYGRVFLNEFVNVSPLSVVLVLGFLNCCYWPRSLRWLLWLSGVPWIRPTPLSLPRSYPLSLRSHSMSRTIRSANPRS